MDVCALSYVWTIFGSGDSSEREPKKDAMAALLGYYEATMAYRGATA